MGSGGAKGVELGHEAVGRCAGAIGPGGVDRGRLAARRLEIERLVAAKYDLDGVFVLVHALDL